MLYFSKPFRRPCPPLPVFWLLPLAFFGGCGQDPLSDVPAPMARTAFGPAHSSGLFQQARRQKLLRFTVNGEADLKMPFAEGMESRYVIKAENFDVSAYPPGSKFSIDLPAVRQIQGMAWEPDKSGLSAVLTWRPHDTYNKAAEVREISFPLIFQAEPPPGSSQPVLVIERQAGVTVKKTVRPPEIYRAELGASVYQKLEDDRLYFIPEDPINIKIKGPFYFEVKKAVSKTKGSALGGGHKDSAPAAQASLETSERVWGDFSVYPLLFAPDPQNGSLTAIEQRLAQRIGQPRYRKKADDSCQSPEKSDSPCFEKMTDQEISYVDISEAADEGKAAVYERRGFLKAPHPAVYEKMAGYACKGRDFSFERAIGKSVISFCFVEIEPKEIEKGFLTDNIFIRGGREGLKSGEEHGYRRLPPSHLSYEYHAMPLSLLLEMAGYKPAEELHFTLKHSHAEMLNIYANDSNYSEGGPKLVRKEADLSPVTFRGQSAVPVEGSQGLKWRISQMAMPVKAAGETEYARALESLVFGGFSRFAIDLHVLSGAASSPIKAAFSILPKIRAEYRYVFDSDQTKFSQSAVTRHEGGGSKTEITKSALSLRGRIIVSHFFPAGAARGFLQHAPLKSSVSPEGFREALDEVVRAEILPDFSPAAERNINLCRRLRQAAQGAEDLPGRDNAGSIYLGGRIAPGGVLTPSPDEPDFLYPEPEAAGGSLKSPLQALSCECAPLESPAESDGRAPKQAESALRSLCRFSALFETRGEDSGYASYVYDINSVSGLYLSEGIFQGRGRLFVFEPERSHHVIKESREAPLDSSNFNAAGSLHVFYNLKPEIHCAPARRAGKKDCVIYYPLSKARTGRKPPPLEKWIAPSIKCGRQSGEEFACPCESLIRLVPGGFALTDTLTLQKPGLMAKCSFDKGEGIFVSAGLKTKEPNIFFLDNTEEKSGADIHQTKIKTLRLPEAAK